MLRSAWKRLINDYRRLPIASYVRQLMQRYEAFRNKARDAEERRIARIRLAYQWKSCDTVAAALTERAEMRCALR